MISNSPEFFINCKSIPDEDSVEYDAFFEREREKIEYGVTVDDVFIHGWLYWHLNHWFIIKDEDKDERSGLIKRKVGLSDARDNEWIIADALAQAEREQKGAMIFGSRRLGKTEFEASYVARSATINKDTENAITGGNWKDIDLISNKLIMGLDHLHPYFRTARIKQDLRKGIELGFKDKKQKLYPWSKIMFRNFDNGNDTEAAAGITATSFVLDECGKFPFAESFAAAIPSFTSEYGWRCTPILTGTSGDIKPNSDAERFFTNPESFNFIMRELVNEGNKKVSVFISGLRRMEGKINTTFADYVKTEHGILVPADSELHSIKFKNSDFEKAGKVIADERAVAAKNPDPTILLKAKMYYPLNTKELFLTDNGNNFPLEAIIDHIAYLEANPDQQGLNCSLYRSAENKVCISFNTDKKPILDYPIKADAPAFIKDACIVLYELPMQNAPYYLYIAGADPYNTSSSANSSSLGCVYVFKRMYDAIGGTFQRRIVASYTARPPHLKTFHDNVEMLMELYGAICLPENAGGNTFIQHFDNKNKGYLIADSYSFLKEISPSTSVINQPKGLPATPKVQAFYKELTYQYCIEEIIVGVDANGNPIQKLGVTRIPDIALLRELLAYSDDEGNFDRYVAFGHALAHEVWADKIYPSVTKFVPQTEPDKQQEKPKPKIRSPFDLGTPTNPFGIGYSNPFGIKTVGSL